MGETLKERVAYRGYASAEWLARTLPEPAGRRLFRALGALAHALLPGVRTTVTANQAQVLGLDPGASLAAAATREAFDLYARYWHDTFRLRALPAEEVRRRVEAEGLEHLDRALSAGRGVVGVTPHMGNWDAVGRWLCLQGYRLVAVAERVRPPRLFELFLRHREELGMRILPLEPGGVGHKLAGFLAENWIVGLVADRDLSGRGVEVEMFGRRRRLPAGPALLALSCGAPLLVCAAYTTERGWRFVIHAPLEVERTGDLRADAAALTRRVAAEFERAIAAHPADWHMFQPAWEGTGAGGRGLAGPGGRAGARAHRDGGRP